MPTRKGKKTKVRLPAGKYCRECKLHFVSSRSIGQHNRRFHPVVVTQVDPFKEEDFTDTDIREMLRPA